MRSISIVGGDNLSLPDRNPALDRFGRRIAELEADHAADAQVLRAARLTRARVALALSHLSRLPALLNRQDLAEQALAGVDIRAFAPPLRVSLDAIVEQLRWSSPIFRHALRLALALGFGYALIELVPGLRHGNWILLTIAVIMRASYSATRQRRDQRLLGSILGCGLAGALLWLGSSPLLLAVQLLAVAIAHAYVKVDYRLTSVAATVMALLGLASDRSYRGAAGRGAPRRHAHRRRASPSCSIFCCRNGKARAPRPSPRAFLARLCIVMPTARCAGTRPSRIIGWRGKT